MSVRGPLHERGDALELVAAEAARARSGTGRLLLLSGATGTGRTALLEAAAGHGETHGMRVLRARCSPDTNAPFAAVLQLLSLDQDALWQRSERGPGAGEAIAGVGAEEGAGADVGAGARVGVGAGATAPSPVHSHACARSHAHAHSHSHTYTHTHDDDRVHDDGRAGARLWRLLLAHAGDAPLLVAVDDVHRADEQSRQWLADAARRIDRLPVLLVVTERAQYDVDPAGPGLAHALSPDLVRTHALAPLSADSAAELVRSAFDDALPDAWVDDCVRACAGSPLLLHALLDDLRAVPGGRTPAPVPATCAALYPGAYPAAVSWWLDCAGPATTDVARSLTLATADPAGHAPYADAELLAGMAGADPARVPGWLTSTTRLGMLRPSPDGGHPDYAHPLLRDAVSSGWPGARRQAAHRAAAETMLRRGDPAEAVAGHVLRAPAIGAPWAVGVLLDAASAAVRAGRAGDAPAFLRRALEEPLTPERRSSVLTELGSLEFVTVRPAAGMSRLAEAVRLPGTPRDRVRAAVAFGTALTGQGETRAAIVVLRSLDEQLRDHPGLVRTVRTASTLLSDQDPDVRREMYRRLRETADHSPHLVGTAGRALLVRYEATAGLTSARTAVRRVRALLEEPSDPLGEPFLLGTAAAVTQWADELDEAERLVERGLAGQSASLLHPMHAALLNVRADIAAARGAHEDVTPAPRPAGPVGRAPGNQDALAVLALVERGRTETATTLADDFELRDAPGSWEANRFLYARGVLRAADGDPGGALDDFLECGRRQSAREVLSPVVTPWRTAAAECRVALGRPEEALALAREELRLATVWNTPRLVGRSLSSLGTATGGRQGLDLADRAVRLLREAPAGTELPAALIAQGRQLTAAGERTRAREPLREAAERAERLGAVRLHTQAQQALREAGARRAAAPRTGTDALTPSERRIATLAANGHTNPEISTLLHLARRTVETHLTSAFRKLGIRGRGELAGALGRGACAGKAPHCDGAGHHDHDAAGFLVHRAQGAG
ncbi:AAA family ATPase [Streptomyces sp. NPDC006173]|uniref:helix-turn-helix transcriptional regulator n=1 Tax=Streptomyces sp. NPDC006173 TaxID=3155349 RepID=UPI0033BFD4F4